MTGPLVNAPQGNIVAVTTAYEVAGRFIGIHEEKGAAFNPLIVAMIQSTTPGPAGASLEDETPWCSAFVNFVARMLDLPRSQSLRARSWLRMGEDVPSPNARVGFDVVVLSRGSGRQPGPDVINAPGHVGFFGGFRIKPGMAVNGTEVLLLAGNQGDAVSEAWFPAARVLGIRRLMPKARA